jgi:hypothetical protein
MAEMGDVLSMKFKGEFPSAELLCRRTIQRCKDEAAARKEKKLADARRADATADRVGSMQIGKPESPPKSPPTNEGPRNQSAVRRRPGPGGRRATRHRGQRVRIFGRWGTAGRAARLPLGAAEEGAPRGLRLTRSLPDDNMKQWLADKKVKEEQRSKLKKQGSQKDLMWMKQLSEKQLARAKSLRKEQDDAARSARESERSGASTPTPFLGSDRSGANTPSTPERPTDGGGGRRETLRRPLIDDVHTRPILFRIPASTDSIIMHQQDTLA